MAASRTYIDSHTLAFLAYRSPSLHTQFRVRDFMCQLVDPELALTLHLDSAKPVDWVCGHNHTYQASVAERARGKGCQRCKGLDIASVSYTHLTLPTICSV